jgi:hypothetical protein
MEETIEWQDGKCPEFIHLTHKMRNLQMKKGEITGWAQSVMDNMKARYPIDSLVRKKN